MLSLFKSKIYFKKKFLNVIFQGVCCGSNGSVCCPNNYDCNEQQLSCEYRDSISLRKLLSTTEYYQCESSDVLCSSEQTCCRTPSTYDTEFACCPYPNVIQIFLEFFNLFYLFLVGSMLFRWSTLLSQWYQLQYD